MRHTTIASASALLGAGTGVTSDWRQTLPVLTGQQVVLREMRALRRGAAARAAHRRRGRALHFAAAERPSKGSNVSSPGRSGSARPARTSARRHHPGVRQPDRNFPGARDGTRLRGGSSGASRSARLSGAPACFRTARSSCSSSCSRRSACTGSKPVPRSSTSAASAPWARLVRSGKASCASRSSATASSSTRRSIRCSKAIGAHARPPSLAPTALVH